ncbi:unnamed protein product [Staurois parvus]|uniref:Uncharacterized protein n=1 Tax=Staurois parvus TaxID=386267 RepID=A0ABN9CW00_9NEOB|nr:unnamed protein product [Staurois parvus]
MNKKKNITHTPNKDQRCTGTAAAGIVFFSRRSAFMIAFTSSGRRCPPPLPSMAFLGSPVPSGEPENAAGVSAS